MTSLSIINLSTKATEIQVVCFYEKTFCTVLMILLIGIILSACSEKAYRINDIIDLNDEQPVSIVIRFDDPSYEPVEINNMTVGQIIGRSPFHLARRRIMSRPSPSKKGKKYLLGTLTNAFRRDIVRYLIK